ncbi:IS21 family transposase [Heliorestis convoluta]|uniref:Putative transposase n=1 Tax=Heliorestis convoluta TaxID=356322 RepID=A0A5Q2MVQ5_9FIRM|nr:IS21 family transposase [Heliorestis convoluta]QGG46324.1 putative transposase [Heliorestis convoluta]
MIKVDTYKYIKDLHIKKRESIRQISRDTGLSRQTIRKILYGSVEEVTQYKRNVPPPAPLKEQYAPIIRDWIVENLTAPPKQRYTASRIFERLQEEKGFIGGASTVRGWVKEIKHELNIERIETYVPLEHDPVGRAQCDWTPAVARINGQDIKGDLFLMRFSNSSAFYIRFYPHQRQEAFFDAHEKTFAFFNGVPQSILYDNLKTAVKRVLVGRKREEQDSFVKFRAHHGFDSEFCNRAKGNEKGKIESLARYVKWHVFTPVPEFPTIEALNNWIEERCRKLNAKPRGRNQQSFWDAFELERDKLLPISVHTFDCCTRKEAKVNRFSLVQFDRNQYSVPTEYTGKMVTVKGYVDKIEIYYQKTKIATHERCYDSGKQKFLLEHYLKLLERKPRAVGQAKPVRQANLPKPFAKYHEVVQSMDPEEGDRQFVKVLLLLKRFPVHIVSEALISAVKQNRLSPVDVEQIVDTIDKPSTKTVSSTNTEVLKPTGQVAPTQLQRYASLVKGGVGA